MADDEEKARQEKIAAARKRVSVPAGPPVIAGWLTASRSSK